MGLLVLNFKAMKPPKAIIYLTLSVLVLFSIIDFFRGGIVFTLLQRYTFIALMALCVGCMIFYFIKDVCLQKPKRR